MIDINIDVRHLTYLVHREQRIRSLRGQLDSWFFKHRIEYCLFLMGPKPFIRFSNPKDAMMFKLVWI